LKVHREDEIDDRIGSNIIWKDALTTSTLLDRYLSALRPDRQDKSVLNERQARENVR
jgi:hypothetical protein